MDKNIIFLIVWFSILFILLLYWTINCSLSIKKQLKLKNEVKVIQSINI